MAKGKQKRLIDNAKIQELVAELHMKQLELLLRRLEDQTIEAQEMRIIWDIAKSHHIGVDTVEDLVNAAQAKATGKIQELELDENWSFEPIIK